MYLYPGWLLDPASSHGKPTIQFQRPWAEIARPFRQPSWLFLIGFVSHVFYGSFFSNTETPFTSMNPRRVDLSNCWNFLSLPFYYNIVFLADSNLFKYCCHAFFRQEADISLLCIATAIHAIQCSRSPPWGTLRLSFPQHFSGVEWGKFWVSNYHDCFLQRNLFINHPLLYSFRPFAVLELKRKFKSTRIGSLFF